MSAIFIVALISLMIKHQNADKVSFGSTRGCDSACQKECIDVINKYRLNHRANEVTFSQYLADKAQNWADGGTFGYDMNSRGKYGQLIEWDVKNELQNFTTVIKHWHDKERYFNFASSRSKTGKTLHDFTQIVWKKARKAGCAQSEIFGSKYYVVWMDSDGVVNPNIEVGEGNIGSPKKDDLHWFESFTESSKTEPIHLVPSKLQEELSSTRASVEPEQPIISTTGKVRSDQHKPISAPELNNVLEEQRALNNDAMLKKYLYQDSLNNVVLDENKETASYHVVPGAKENANWQKGAESLIQLDKHKSNSSSENVNDGMASFPADTEDDGKQAARFQSLVIQDDDMLTKDEEDDNGTLSSEGNGGDDLEEGDENKQATAIQSLMNQEDDMIQNQNDEEDEESSGNHSTVDTAVPSNYTNSKVSSNGTTSNSSKTTGNLSGKPTSYYSSGVALNKDPNITASSEPSVKPSLDSTEENLNSSICHGMTNQSSMDSHQESPNASSSNNSLNNGHNVAGLLTEPISSTLSQNDTPGGQQFSNVSASQSVENRIKNNQPEIKQSETTDTAGTGTASTNLVSGNNRGKAVGFGSSTTALTSQNGLQMASEPQIGSMAMMPNSQSRVQLAEVIKPGTTAHQGGKTSDDSHAQATSTQSQQIMSTMSAASSSLKNQHFTLGSNGFSQSAQTTGPNTAIPSTDAIDITGHNSVSDLHQVTSPAVITLPKVSSRPIKLVFHVKDMKSKGMSADGSEALSAYPLTTAGDDITNKMNDDECHDDTVQCQLWALHGHCKGITYTAFMKRHCKATCGYCGLPSIIKESVKHLQTSSLAQDEPCEDTPSYEFSCPRWQVQGYCEKRQKEMNLVCRKTCGFCVPTKPKSRLSLSFHPSSASPKTGNMQAPKISQQFTASPPKLNLNDILKNKAKFNPSSAVQSLNSSPIKPKANSTLENGHGPQKLSSLKAFRPFGSSMMNQNGKINAKNTSEGSIVSAQDFYHEKSPEMAGNMTIKSKGDKQRAGLYNLNKPLLKQSAATASLLNKTKIAYQLKPNTSSSPVAHGQGMAKIAYQTKPNTPSTPIAHGQGVTKIAYQTTPNTPSSPVAHGQGVAKIAYQTTPNTPSSSVAHEQGVAKIAYQTKPNTPSLSVAHEQGVTNKLENFTKAPVKVDLKSLGFSKPQVAATTSFIKNWPNQQYHSQEEDKVIENGINALQHRLQAPLEITAVAKSKPGCGKKLCKEKTKTQQAKTRETIGNRVPHVSSVGKTKDTPVSTKGCDAACQQRCLAAHNIYRLNHGAPTLILDQGLANQAQQWADKKVFKHSPWAGGQGGESIALGSLYPSFTAAVKAWHDEEKDYDWSTGEGKGDMKVNHFTQVVWKRAHLLGCGKTLVDGEPYYIAQMDTPGVIAGEPGFEKSNVGQPKEPDLMWFMDSSPYWKEMQTKDSIPKNIEHLIL